MHHAILPRYRGASAGNFWVLVNQERKTGITVHFVEEKIDGGEILAQESIDISSNDTVYGLHAKCASLSLHCLEYVIEKLREKGELYGILQDERIAFTYSFPTNKAYRSLRACGRKSFRPDELLKI